MLYLYLIMLQFWTSARDDRSSESTPHYKPGNSSAAVADLNWIHIFSFSFVDIVIYKWIVVGYSLIDFGMGCLLAVAANMVIIIDEFIWLKFSGFRHFKKKKKKTKLLSDWDSLQATNRHLDNSRNPFYTRRYISSNEIVLFNKKFKKKCNNRSALYENLYR